MLIAEWASSFGDLISPFRFVDFSEEEKQAVLGVVSKYLPPAVSQDFNVWYFYKIESKPAVKRTLWTYPVSFKSMDNMLWTLKRWFGEE